MSQHQLLAIKIDPFRQHFTPILLKGNNLARPIQRVLKARQLGWMELCRIDAIHQIGHRQRADGLGTETYDGGPTPLMVAADASPEENHPGFRLRGIGKATAGHALLFGRGLGGGMVNCPVDKDWLARHLVWLTAEEAAADEDEVASDD